jgi:hypothetical protein
VSRAGVEHPNGVADCGQAHKQAKKWNCLVG